MNVTDGKIVFLAHHACMRMTKMAMVLLAKGYDVHLITHRITQFSEHFNSVTQFQNTRQLRHAINLHKDAVLFHAHNEPSWFVTAVKEMTDKPVVLDVHDSILLRRSHEEVEKANDEKIFRISVDERNNIQMADALIYVCNPMKEIVELEYTPTVPSEIVPSAVPRQFYRYDFFKWHGGLIYEGRINTPGELKKEWSFFDYCNYLEFAKQCKEMGIPFEIFTPRKNVEVRKAYSQHTFVHEPLSYDKMIRAMGHHDWGLVGNCFKTSEWEVALPNKLFEYMSACLPVICFNADESWNMIKDYGMGIKVDSFEEIADRWSEHRKCRENVVKHRMKFCLENYRPKIENLYAQVLGRTK